MNIKKSCFAAFMSCLSFILSTFVSFPFVVPFQHFCNVICAVFVGPVYAFISALITGCMRMLLTGRPVTAIIGAVIGAFLSGIFYILFRKIFFAVIGEILGTGFFSALISFFVMKYCFSVNLSTPFFYIPLFLPACTVGALLGYAVLILMNRAGTLSKIRRMLT